jgi:hypothetical protein
MLGGHVTSDERDDETATGRRAAIDTSAVAHADLTLEQRVDATLARPAPIAPADNEPSTLEPNLIVRGLGERGARLEDAPTGRLEDAPTARRGQSIFDDEEKATKQFDSRGILEAFDASLEASSRTLQRPAAGQPPAVTLPSDERQEDEDEATMLHARPLDDAELDALEPTELAPNATAVRLGASTHPALGEQPTVSIITAAGASPSQYTSERGLPVIGVDVDPDEFGSKGGTQRIVVLPEEMAALRRGAPPRGGSPSQQSVGNVAVPLRAQGSSAVRQGNAGPVRAGASTVPLIAPQSTDAHSVAGEPRSAGSSLAQRAASPAGAPPEPPRAALTQPQTSSGVIAVPAAARPRGRAGRVALVFLLLLVASIGAGALYVKRRGTPAFVTRLLRGRAIAAAPTAVGPASSASAASSASVEGSASSSPSSLTASSSPSSLTASSSPSSLPASADSSSPLASSTASASSSSSPSPSASSSSHRGGAHPPRSGPRAPKPATSKPPTP